jgi:hypothetical protein
MKRANKKFQRLAGVSKISSRETVVESLRGSDRHPESSNRRDSARDEDGSAAAGVLVENRTGPATDNGRAKIRSTIGQSFHPYVRDIEFLKVEFL